MSFEEFDAAPVLPEEPEAAGPVIPIVAIAAVATVAQERLAAASLDLDQRIARADSALRALLAAGHPVAVSWSAGKDSSTALNLLLTAAAAMVREGKKVPPIVITHADTGIENPEMSLYARNEMIQVRQFAKLHGLAVHIETSHPNLTDVWAVRVIGGRALPPFPGTNRDCSSDWKVAPMQKLRKAVLKRLAAAPNGEGARPEPVVLLGTRYDESTTRGANMSERGESDIQVRRGIDANGRPSHLFLSPLAHWTTDNVWEYLGMVRGGAIPGYSNFEETFRVYADAMGTSCVIVGEDMSKMAKSSKACGARHGCSLCTVVEKDQSMENMLAGDDRYGYMRGLNSLRNFLTDSRWDMDRRSWIGRTVREGYISIGPDAYSPAMLEELLRYSLTIDAEEREASSAAGIPPRFQLVTLEQLFAIDSMWSLQAFHRPFHALKIYDDIQRGERYPVPKVREFKRPKELVKRYRWVGRDWEDGHEMAYTGLRSVIHDLVAGESAGCMGTKELADGRKVLDVNTGNMLEFDAEVGYWVLDEDLPRLLREYHDNPSVSPTQAYFYYATLGFMTVKNGMQGEIDAMLRRANFKVREGLAGQQDGRALWESSLTADEAGRTAGKTKRMRGAEGSRSTAHLSLADIASEVLLNEPSQAQPAVQAQTEPAQAAMDPAEQQIDLLELEEEELPPEAPVYDRQR